MLFSSNLTPFLWKRSTALHLVDPGLKENGECLPTWCPTVAVASLRGLLSACSVADSNSWACTPGRINLAIWIILSKDLGQGCAQLKSLTQESPWHWAPPALGQVTIEWPQQPALCPETAGPGGSLEDLPFEESLRLHLRLAAGPGTGAGEEEKAPSPSDDPKLLEDQGGGLDIAAPSVHHDHGNHTQMVDLSAFSLPHTSGCTPFFCDHIFPSRLLSVFT